MHEANAIGRQGSAAQGGPDDFRNAMIHLYRGEMNRMTVWRTRLDTTSNWAILLSTGITTFALGSPAVPHYMLLLGLALIGICIVIESRRYLHLLHSRWRCYMLEGHFFRDMLLPGEPEADPSWRSRLAEDLVDPHIRCGLFYAMRLRLRRNYIFLVYFVSAVWLTKVLIHPQGATSWAEFWGRLAFGNIFPSWFVGITASVFVVGCTLLALSTPSEEALDVFLTRGHGGCGRKRT